VVRELSFPLPDWFRSRMWVLFPGDIAEEEESRGDQKAVSEGERWVFCIGILVGREDNVRFCSCSGKRSFCKMAVGVEWCWV